MQFGFATCTVIVADCYEANHSRAASSSPASKYLIADIVNGLQIAAIHFSQAFSPTIATFSMSRQCLVANLISSHTAPISQPWKSFKMKRTLILPEASINFSTPGSSVS